MCSCWTVGKTFTAIPCASGFAEETSNSKFKCQKPRHYGNSLLSSLSFQSPSPITTPCVRALLNSAIGLSFEENISSLFHFVISLGLNPGYQKFWTRLLCCIATSDAKHMSLGYFNPTSRESKINFDPRQFEVFWQSCWRLEALHLQWFVIQTTLQHVDQMSQRRNGTPENIRTTYESWKHFESISRLNAGGFIYSAEIILTITQNIRYIP